MKNAVFIYVLMLILLKTMAFVPRCWRPCCSIEQ